MERKEASKVTFRSGRVLFEWHEGTNTIVMEHADSGGTGLPIEAPPGLRRESLPFTLWACEFLGIVMADQPTWQVAGVPLPYPSPEGDRDRFVVMLRGPIEDFPAESGVLAPMPEVTF